VLHFSYDTQWVFLWYPLINVWQKKFLGHFFIFVSRESGFHGQPWKKSSSAVIKMVLKVLDCDFQKHKDSTLIYITLVILQKITLITIEISRNLHWASMATETESNTKFEFHLVILIIIISLPSFNQSLLSFVGTRAYKYFRISCAFWSWVPEFYIYVNLVKFHYFTDNNNV